MKNPKTGRPFFTTPPPEDRCAVCGCHKSSHSIDGAFVPSTVSNANDIREKVRLRREYARQRRMRE